MTHASVAASVRRAKEAHPENYCAEPRCLWRVVNGQTGEIRPCPKHPTDVSRYSPESHDVSVDEER
jgi:hypothetical protein